jgi:CheY-like chemotaxis protein
MSAKPVSRILIAEDDRTTRRFLCEVLRAEKFTVFSAADGQAALRQLRKKKFDLLLLDIWMPRMNGLELLALLRQEPTPPRIVVMTADGTPDTVLRAVREQAYRYVTKPVKPNELIEIVCDALSDEPQGAPIEVLSARPTWVELLVPCNLLAGRRVQEFLERLKADLPDDVRRTIGQAFHELLSNAIEWGGKLDPNRKCRIACVRTPRMVLYRIADPGPGFRQADLKHAAISNPADDPMAHFEEREKKGLRPGGLGLLLTSQMVDELVYNEAQNEVLFVKYLDATPPS